MEFLRKIKVVEHAVVFSDIVDVYVFVVAIIGLAVVQFGNAGGQFGNSGWALLNRGLPSFQLLNLFTHAINNTRKHINHKAFFSFCLSILKIKMTYSEISSLRLTILRQTVFLQQEHKIIFLSGL